MQRCWQRIGGWGPGRKKELAHEAGWQPAAAGKLAPPFTPPHAVQDFVCRRSLRTCPNHAPTMAPVIATPIFNLPPTWICTLLFLFCIWKVEICGCREGITGRSVGFYQAMKASYGPRLQSWTTQYLKIL